jgi:hypothetical protein
MGQCTVPMVHSLVVRSVWWFVLLHIAPIPGHVPVIPAVAVVPVALVLTATEYQAGDSHLGE